MTRKLKNFTLDLELINQIKVIAKKLNRTESYLVGTILKNELDKYSKDTSLMNLENKNQLSRLKK